MPLFGAYTQALARARAKGSLLKKVFSCRVIENGVIVIMYASRRRKVPHKGFFSL
jgi:hypothetical protein